MYARFTTEEADSGQKSLSLCDTAWGLLDTFGLALRDLVRLHEDQFQAIVDGETDAGRFDLLIHLANERKNDAKYAYIAHCEHHGCWPML